MSYDVEIAAALRYAAAALMLRPTASTDTHSLRVLHTDAALLLAETGYVVTRIRPEGGFLRSVPELARHPVRVMLSHLNLIAHPTVPLETPPPSERWSGLPASPSAAHDPVQAWKGLVTHLFFARHAIDAERGLSREQAWTITGDLAVLAETLSTSMIDLLPPRGPGEAAGPRSVRILATSLGVDAREVVRLSALTGGGATSQSPAPPAGPRGIGVVTIPGPYRLPDALVLLTHLLRTEEPSVPDLLAVTRVLSRTSNATASALASAASVSGVPDHLSATAAALTRHADQLADAVATHQKKFGSITPGAPILIAQAREIGAIAVPGLRALAEDPIRAEAASPHLLRVAQLLPGAADAVTASLTELDARGLTYYRDTVHGWRRTTPGDLAALTVPLNDAATAARSAPAPIRDTITRSIPAGHLAASGAHIDLQAALRRRQESLRPSRPSQHIEHAGGVPIPERYS